MTPENIKNKAVLLLGTDFTNDNLVSDRVSCSFAVTTILNSLDGNIPIMPSTHTFWQWLKNSPQFNQVLEPMAGDIIISPTGTSPLDGVVGHTGIFISDSDICSNSSADGIWKQNYTRLSWRKYFHEYLELPSYLFRPKS